MSICTPVSVLVAGSVPRSMAADQQHEANSPFADEKAMPGHHGRGISIQRAQLGYCGLAAPCKADRCFWSLCYRVCSQITCGEFLIKARSHGANDAEGATARV